MSHDWASPVISCGVSDAGMLHSRGVAAGGLCAGACGKVRTGAHAGLAVKVERMGSVGGMTGVVDRFASGWMVWLRARNTLDGESGAVAETV